MIIERMIIMPPGSAPAAVTALQQAFAALGDDRAFREDAMHTIQFVPRFAQGERVERWLGDALKPDDEIVDFLHRHIEKGEGASKRWTGRSSTSLTGRIARIGKPSKKCRQMR
jgi:hypothetical protein